MSVPAALSLDARNQALARMDLYAYALQATRKAQCNKKIVQTGKSLSARDPKRTASAAAKSRIKIAKSGHANDLTDAKRPTLQKSTREGRKPECE